MAKKHYQMLKKIKKEFESKGYFLFATSERILSGVPDIIGVSPEGKFIGIEIKTGDSKNPEKLLKPIQKYFKNRIIKNKGEFYIYFGNNNFSRIIS